MQAMQDVVANRSFDAKYEELCELQERCQNDRTALQVREALVASLHSELGSREYRLMTEEQDYAAAELCTLEVDLTELSDHSLMSDCQKASSDVPSLLERYYDRKGDIGIQFERLNELDEVQYEEAVHRDFIADRGELPQTLDDEFILKYEERRQHILSELAAAQKDAEQLAQACMDAGIHPRKKPDISSVGTEGNDEASYRSEASSAAPPLMISRSRHCNESLVVHSSAGQRIESELSGDESWRRYGDLKNRVTKWLATLTDERPTRADSTNGYDLFIDALDLASKRMEDTTNIESPSWGRRRGHSLNRTMHPYICRLARSVPNSCSSIDRAIPAQRWPP